MDKLFQLNLAPTHQVMESK